MGGWAQVTNFLAREGRRDELVEVFREAYGFLRGVPACELNVMATSESEPDCLWFIEVWDARSSHTAITEGDFFKAWATKVPPLVESLHDQARFEPVGGRWYRDASDPFPGHLIHTTLRAAPGRREDLVAKFLEAAQIQRDNPDCQLELVSTSPTDDDLVYLTELWTSAEAHKRATEMPAIAEWSKDMPSMVAEMVASEQYAPVDAIGRPA